jgi:hypothetical protein
MLRYFSSNRVQTNKTMQCQAEELLNVVSTIQDYGMLLKKLHEYPIEVICACHDYMGNTLLHLILSQSSRREIKQTNGEVVKEIKPSKTTATSRWFGLRGSNHLKTSKEATLLQLVQYLVQCTDESNDEINAMYSSMIRQKSAGGSLPLHIACRFCSEQQLDIVQYLIEGYPNAVHCPDIWGNVPLHEACDVAVVPLEIILVLITEWPESTRACNADGNIPLHLVAASKAKSYICTPDTLNSLDTNNDNNVTAALAEQAPITDKSYHEESGDRSIRELRQLEIVQYLVEYWPESVHFENHQGQTALQLAVESNSNLLVIEFLQSMAVTINSPCLVPPISSNYSNPFDSVDEIPILNSLPNDLSTDQALNPFDDDNEILDEGEQQSSNPVENDEVPVLCAVSTNNLERENEGLAQIDDPDDDSDNSEAFDGVVELAEDYFEVVVDRIDQDEENFHPYHGTYPVNFGSIEIHNDSFHIPTHITQNNVETVGSTFVAPIG